LDQHDDLSFWQRIAILIGLLMVGLLALLASWEF
jgi:hypothetical protein